MEAHRAGIYRLNVFHLRLEFPSTYAPVACEAKDHIVSGAGITVVEFETRAQGEFIRCAIRAFAPRLCQCWPHALPWQRAHHRIVDGVQNAKGRNLRRCLGRVEPTGGNRDVHGIHEFPRGLGLGLQALHEPGGAHEDTNEQGQTMFHRHLLRTFPLTDRGWTDFWRQAPHGLPDQRRVHGAVPSGYTNLLHCRKGAARPLRMEEPGTVTGPVSTAHGNCPATLAGWVTACLAGGQKFTTRGVFTAHCSKHMRFHRVFTVTAGR